MWKKPRCVALACAGIIAACSNAPVTTDFALHDDRGNVWAMSEQRGRALLLTGFTHCADTCPATLAKLSRMTASLGKRADDVEIVFVTIDPARDTPPVLHRFIASFEQRGASRVIGLTGTPEQIASVERVYHVWSQPLPRHDYAHNDVIFLIDSSGRIRALRDADDSESAIAHAVAEMLG